MNKYYVIAYIHEPNAGPTSFKVTKETIRSKTLNTLFKTLESDYESLKKENILQIPDVSISVYRDYFTKKAEPLATRVFRDNQKDAEKRLEKRVREALKHL